MSRIAIYTKNEKEYNEAMKMLDNLGYRWCDGDSCNTEWRPDGGVNKLIYLFLYSNDKTVTFNQFEEPGECDYIISLKEFMKQFFPSSFTKADLEDGMVVETYDNRYYMYFKKLKKFVGEDGFLWTDSYNNDLTYKYEEDSTFSIKTVFVIKTLCSLNLFKENKINGLEKIWERPEKVRMTIKEIEEKLGIKNLEIVEEK